jgi:ketosteroid isomerase-like protein
VAASHVDVIERLFGLSNRCAAGDAEALAELTSAYHPDAVLESLKADATPVEPGEAGIRSYFLEVTSSYEEWHCALDYAQDYGDRVLALGALRVVARGGSEQEQALGWIFTFRGDKIEAVQAYPSYGDALRAATARPSLAPR